MQNRQNPKKNEKAKNKKKNLKIVVTYVLICSFL